VLCPFTCFLKIIIKENAIIPDNIIVIIISTDYGQIFTNEKHVLGPHKPSFFGLLKCGVTQGAHSDRHLVNVYITFTIAFIKRLVLVKTFS